MDYFNHDWIVERIQVAIEKSRPTDVILVHPDVWACINKNMVRIGDHYATVALQNLAREHRAYLVIGETRVVK